MINRATKSFSNNILSRHSFFIVLYQEIYTRLLDCMFLIKPIIPFLDAQALPFLSLCITLVCGSGAPAAAAAACN
jgi:hypothetical protein